MEGRTLQDEFACQEALLAQEGHPAATSPAEVTLVEGLGFRV